MSVASRITSMTEHIQNAYDSIERFGVDTESIDKNLVNLSNTITNEIYDKLPKVSGNGSNFTLENAQNGKLDLFEMEGNTHQDSYTGKNLAIFGPPASTVSGLTITYDNITGKISVKGKSNTTAGIRISAKSDTLIPNGTYTLSINSPLSSLINYTITDSQENNIAFRIPAGSTSVTNSLTNNGVLAQLFLAVENNVDYDLEFYLQLETGSTPTSFEPYVGGVPSPNPDYPQEIEVVENKQNINVSGKNLFYIEDIPYGTGVGITMTKNNDGSYTFNGTVRNGLIAFRGICDLSVEHTLSFTSNKAISGIFVRTRIGNIDENPTIQDQINITTQTNGKVTSSKTISFVEITIANNTVVDNFTIFPQLELGDTATTYEPYHNKDYEIDLHGKNLCSSVELQNAANIRFYIDKKIEKTITISFTTNEKLNNNSLYLSATDALATTITADANTKATATFTLSDEQYNAIQSATNPYFLLFKSGANFTIPTDAQIENDSTATEYEEFYDYKLCKIGDYQDVIFKNNQLSSYYDSTLDEDSWYIKKEIGKVVLDGSEDWTAYGSNLYTLQTFFNDNPFIVGYGLSNLYKYNPIQSGISAGTTNGEFILQKSSNNYNLFIKNTDIGTLENLKASLLEKNMIVYYPTVTPTYEKITNSTLITQLEALETETGTNIFEVSNDNDVLPSLNVKRLKELEKLS